jgi:hypothetical protein
METMNETTRPNNGMQRTALRAAADAERWADCGEVSDESI